MPGKQSISELLQENVKLTDIPRQNLKAFLIEKNEIEEALNDHWPISKIWKALKTANRISFSESVLRRLVSVHILKTKTPKKRI